MKISVEFQPDRSVSAPVERETAGDLRIEVDGENATRHSAAGGEHETVTIAAFGLANGLAHDWWLLFGGRDRLISLVKHRSGFLVPDVQFRFDGESAEIAAVKRVYRNGNVETVFRGGLLEASDRESLEMELGGFIESVVGQLRDQGIEGSSVALRWERVKRSRENSEEAAFCEAAGALGVDPYEIDAESEAFIGDAEKRFTAECLLEFLAGSKSFGKQALLGWVDEAARRPRYKARVVDLARIAAEASEKAPKRSMQEKGWSLGYRRARAMRRVLGLGQNDRIKNYKDLAQRLGASREYTFADPVDGIRALRSDKSDGIYIHLRMHGASVHQRASHLFSFARAVGDAACFPEPSVSPINDVQSAFRQAAGRAFAAEFLAPIDEIRSMQESGKDSASIADEFAVAPEVVRLQTENKDRIVQACQLAS